MAMHPVRGRIGQSPSSRAIRRHPLPYLPRWPIRLVLPPGSIDTSKAVPCGAHGQQVDTGFVGLDPDHAWVAYVNYGTPDSMTSCFSHELVELLTDPEQTAWYVQGVPGSSSEIGDLCDI